MASTARGGNVRSAPRVPDALAVAGIAIVLFIVYVVFDLREGGEKASLTTTRIVGPTRYLEFMSGAWLVGMYVLDAVLAVLAAVLLVRSFHAIRQRLRGGGVAACSTGSTVLVGFAAFACPACPLPLLGTIGVSFFASTLPLGGLEFKLLAILIVAAALFWYWRRERAGRVVGQIQRGSP
jgi:hypothetical protein